MIRNLYRIERWYEANRDFINFDFRFIESLQRYCEIHGDLTFKQELALENIIEGFEIETWEKMSGYSLSEISQISPMKSLPPESYILKKPRETL